ncbi:hypothetical protein NKW85_10120 [Staphylococcus simulans]|uniref:hypothetical protein n=1 Tax=Staphylococcus TaxID=1279 RepID=UPI000763D6DC|nr:MULTISPECIES: hypothetical protein [Staphylococcus]MDK8175348.1 hypothetical protein [Staphylococcus simulans]OFM14818.1 hypothetical protein HMPREF2713_09345 [Staphylococcus sp. HMSC059E03]OFN19833.1 hypothetical protein HMPREF2603_08545 [Staphylococcus sp. HMSC055C03]OFO48081.1 hypothetical protein HMPREF3031_06270 [Staphylococcus sp. HMSC072B07]OFV06357.1 hypothetical protein HMPREF3124_06145 [Staphylococcus sp. HMSC12H08]
MELILLICSSGVAGLFTYIYLDYLSIFDTEKIEIKKMFSVLFSLISIGIFMIVLYFINYIHIYNFLGIIIALIISFIVINVLNKSAYPYMIKKFRNKMNKERESNNLNPLNDKHAIDTILQTSNMFYIEKYKDNEHPIYQGILLKHEMTNDLDSIFSIRPTPIIKNHEKVIKEYYYQPKNTDEYYKFYGLKN